MGGDGNDGGTKSGRLVTNDGHQRRNNRPHAGDKLWGFHKNSAYGFLNRITRNTRQSDSLRTRTSIYSTNEKSIKEHSKRHKVRLH